MKTIRIIINLFIVLTFIGCENEPLPIEEEIENPSPIEYSFLVAGHTYGTPGTNNVGLYPLFRYKFGFIKSESLDFGVFTGDIVTYCTEEDWDEVDVNIDTLGIPIYFAVGNHDIGNRELFESRYGQTYYSMIHGSDLYIMLDPNIDNWNISGEQLQFLEQTLEDNYQDVDNVFVFFHQLLWWESDNIYQNVAYNSLDGRAANINFWTEVEPLFNALPNNVCMFAGDMGAFINVDAYMYHQYDNITLIGSGMGGQTQDNMIFVDVHEDKTVGFRLFALNGDNINALGKIEDYMLP